MNQTIAIHQPNYIPWLGYFYKIYLADVFVFLDDVQFSNEGMQNYHYIKTSQGSFRLKIPVKVSFGEVINQVRPRNELNWKEKHLRTIEMNYRKAAFYHVVFNDISELLNRDYDNLASLDIEIIKFICNKFGLKTEFTSSSLLSINTARLEKIIDICNALGCKIYCSGIGARNYQKKEDFEKRGIQLKYSNFEPFYYPQLWDKSQINVSVIDYLMNCGYDWQRVIDNQNKLIK